MVGVLLPLGQDAAGLFKREMWVKNEELRQLQRELKHLREWYVKGMETVATDLHQFRSYFSASEGKKGDRQAGAHGHLDQKQGT